MKKFTPLRLIQKGSFIVRIACFTAVICLFATCGKLRDKVFNDNISEGKIEYAISFPSLEEDGITASLLPEQMTLFFKDDRFSLEFESMGGVFKNRIVAFSNDRKVDHELKVFRKKVRANMGHEEVKEMVAEYPEVTVIFTDETDSIAGYLCKKATVVWSDVDRPEIDVYYTEEIDLQTPNWCTQYSEIPGVLMSYEIEQFGITMRLHASQVYAEKVEPQAFASTEGYEIISREMMQVEVEQLVATFEY